MADTDLVIKISGDSTQAKKSLTDLGVSFKELSDKATKSAKVSELAFGTFLGMLSGDLARRGFDFLVGSFGNIVQAAEEQENAIVKLNNALKLSGGFTEKTSEDFQKYSEKLSLTTKYTDDAILSQLAVAKTFHATDEQAKQIIETAAKMSYAWGTDFNQNVLQLSETLEGNIGRLAKLDGSVKNLNETQVKAGGVIKIFTDRLKNSGTGMDSYSGSTGQLKKSIGELAESMGKIITNSTALRGVFDSLAEAINHFNQRISESPTKLKELQRELARLKDVNLALANPVGTREEQIKSKLAEIEKEKGNEQVAAIKEAETKKQQALDEGIRKRKEAEEQAHADKLKLDQSNFDAVLKELKTSGGTELEQLKNKYEEKKRIIEAAQSEHLKTTTDFNGLLLKLDEEYISQKDKIDAEEYAKFNREEEEGLKEKHERDKINARLDEEKKSQEDTAFNIGLGGNVLKGQAGVTGLLQAGASVAFGPVIGQALAPIIDALAKGPDAVKGMISDFADAVPTVVENIILAIPAVIEVLVQKAPEIITRLVHDIPRVITELVNSIPQIVSSLANLMPEVATSLAEGIIEELPGIAAEMGKQFAKAINPFGGKGSIIGSIPIVGDVFGAIGDLFAEGGSYTKSVPNGFPNDSFPARLTEGELVVDRSTAKGLKDFIDNRGMDANTGILVKILNAVNTPLSVTSEVNLNGKAFADIILNLNRNNARLS